MFADIHCHPTFFSFNRHRNTDVERNHLMFHPWNTAASDERAKAKGRRAMRYAQCDLMQSHAVGARLLFASITPIERGFFEGGPNADDNTSFRKELLRAALGVTAVKTARALLRGDKQAAGRAALAVFRNRGPGRRLLHRLMLGFPKERIDYVLSGRYDYWDEFQREYRYLLERDGLETPYETNDAGATLGRYDLIEDANDLEQTLAEPDGRVAIVLTIEGGHTFSVGQDDQPVSETRLFDRIERLKRWPHPILFITLAHHFDNFIVGHAHSLIDAASYVMSQSQRMGRGFERSGDIGLRVVRALYGLDDALNDDGTRRVLIDGKHLSARARVELYHEILSPICEQVEAGADRALVPMVFSHAGYNARPDLAALIDDAAREDDQWFQGPYNAWSINVCDEDVRMVARTRGLIGLCVDRRIAGLRPGEAPPGDDPGAVWARQIFGMVDAVWDDRSLSHEEKLRVWDCISLGTDYDGAIDPLPGYETIRRLPSARADLRRHLEAAKEQRGIAEIGVDELVDKIAWRNAYEFALRELPRRKKHDLRA
ncbi:MAG: hypothetical protein ACJA1R_002121 [Flavobacteriales bacterium]|jgi:hypothetical protein